MSFWTGVRKGIRTPVGRAGLGLFAMATGAVALWPSPDAVFSPEKALAFVAALGAWLFAEIFPDEHEAAPANVTLDAHDLELGKKMRAIMSDDFIRFLDEHDFGGSFRARDTEPLYTLGDTLRNASSAFNDSELETALETVKSETHALAKLVAYGSAPRNAKESLFTMIPDDEPDGMWSKETEAKVAVVNRKADDLSGAIKILLSLLRKKGFALVSAAGVAAE